MKKMIFALLMIIPFVVFAQSGGGDFTSIGLRSSNTYANSQVDTLPKVGNVTHNKVLTLGSFRSVDFYGNFADSVAADFYVQTRPIGSSVWTTEYSDSIKSLTAALLVKTIPLRSTVYERIGNLGNYVRLIVSFRASGNGVTSPTYTAKLYVKN